MLLRGGGATCVVETGYLYPAPHSVFDLHYSIRTERHYFAVRDAKTLKIVDASRRPRVLAMPTINAPLYPGFVADTLRRIEHNEKPVTDLTDMAAVMELVERRTARHRCRKLAIRRRRVYPDRPIRDLIMEQKLLQLDIVSDAICPWCYIGKRQLERALAMLANDGLHFSLRWNPFQLNPDMPAGGVERAAYRRPSSAAPNARGKSMRGSLRRRARRGWISTWTGSSGRPTRWMRTGWLGSPDGRGYRTPRWKPCS